MPSAFRLIPSNFQLTTWFPNYPWTRIPRKSDGNKGSRIFNRRLHSWAKVWQLKPRATLRNRESYRVSSSPLNCHGKPWKITWNLREFLQVFQGKSSSRRFIIKSFWTANSGWRWWENGIYWPTHTMQSLLKKLTSWLPKNILSRWKNWYHGSTTSHPTDD